MKKFSCLNTSCFGKHFAKICLLIGVSFATMQSAYSQDKKQLILADKYFSGGEYLTAASLYGQYLNTRSNIQSEFPLHTKRSLGGEAFKAATRSEIILKQAESYRLAHYWKEALALYESLYATDGQKHPESLYWMAVCRRNLKAFSTAEENIALFLSKAANNKYKQLAEKEKETLYYIKSQITRPDTILYTVKKITGDINGGNVIYAPLAFGQKNIFFTGIEKDSMSNAETNPNRNRLFGSVLKNDDLLETKPVSIEGLDASMNQGAATISPDGKHIYFTQWKKGPEAVLPSIYFSAKTATGWSKPVSLNTVNTHASSNQQPFCTADGQYLFFASDRAGGYGNMDIWYAPLHPDGTTGALVNAGAAINTPDNEQAPFYHTSSSQLIFASDRTPGMGGLDLYTAHGNETRWEMPANMGFPVNSVRNDVYFFAPEGGEVLAKAIVSSDRDEGCCLSSYTVAKQPKKKIISGIIQDCETKAPLPATAILLKDVKGIITPITTAADGSYSFELKEPVNGYQLLVQKELYKDLTSELRAERSNEKGWLIDELYNATICLEKQPVLKVENVVSVYFDFDRSELKERGLVQLDSIYTNFMQDEKATLQISGYTDGRGSEAYNKILSDKRAKACAAYLIAKGVAPERISFASFGACCPIEMELINGRDNPDGRALNRRALINIVKE